MRAFLYVVGSNSNPHRVECAVPFRIDDKEGFFGPCERPLRQQLRKLLAPDLDAVTPDPDLYLVGFNKADRKPPRKILWAGRIKRVMTFARAWDELVGPRYEALRDPSGGPLHVQPIRDGDGRLVGYRRVTQLHELDWIKDLTRRPPRAYRVENQTDIHVADGATPWDAFERDACFSFEIVFFACGASIEVDDDIVEILRLAQSKRPETIDAYAIFGRQRNDSAEGLRGRWLSVEGGLARHLLAAIEDRARVLEPIQPHLDTCATRVRCDGTCSKRSDLGRHARPAPPPSRRKGIC